VIALELQILAGAYAVSRLSADAPIPEWAQGELVSLTRTLDELSVVSPAEAVPESIKSERGWRALRVAGPLDFSLVGILAELSGVLAQAEIPIFALSTFDTDYLLVGDRDLERAVRTLKSAGHRVVPAESAPVAATGQQ
jgi:uncharacterized protein